MNESMITYTLHDWIPEDKLNWAYLSKNPNAIQLLEENLDKIDWNSLCSNPNSIQLLEKYPEKINWGFIMFKSKRD
jgi:hypothetical protein